MVSKNEKRELSFDQPLRCKDALRTDRLERRNFAEVAVEALGRVGRSAGFVLSIEGAWGSGKTSALALMEALLRQQASAPVVVHFNPWIVGDRDALLRQFLSNIAAAVKLADHAAGGKKVARELKAYGKVFDLLKLVPGAEPWASLVKSVIESTGEAAGSIAEYKTPDVEAKKLKVEQALQHFDRPIIVFIDDVDRLFPLEVFEMVRIIKAVGDLPNVGYVLAWDPDYVSGALNAAGVPRSATYLDKIVQVRLPLPTIDLESRLGLINAALSRLHSEANTSHFANQEDRLRTLYFSGLRQILEHPRDYERVFNTVSVIEPALRGEVVLADIIGLSALMVMAPAVYDLLRREQRWFVGRLPGDHSILKKDDELIKEGEDQRESAFNKCRYPAAVRELVHFMFPLTGGAVGRVLSGRVRSAEGHIAAPARLQVALQFRVGGADVSLVRARRYLVHPDQRSDIVSSLTSQNSLEFLESLGDVAESIGVDGVGDIERLCLDIARLPDVEPISARSRDRSDFFRLPAENIALRAIRLVLNVAEVEASPIAERIANDPYALTVATELFVRSYLVNRDEEYVIRCTPKSRAKLESALAKNILAAAKENRLFATSNPGYILARLSKIVPRQCPSIFAAIKRADPTLDPYAHTVLGSGFDSFKGLRYSLSDNRESIEAYCPLEEFKRHALERLADPNLHLPYKAAWRSVVEDKSIYSVDGTYVSR